MTGSVEPCLVLGLGNVLFTDEGVGVAAAERLAALGLPGVEVLDGGTLGLGLLPAIDGREALLVLDAIAADGTSPGTVCTLDDAALRHGYRTLISAHQIGLPEVLAAAELAGSRPPSVTVVGMVPASLETGVGLSPVAQSQLAAMVERALAVLSRWGITHTGGGDQGAAHAQYHQRHSGYVT